jgi:zinc D-Ala-D-Ala carboxypeptidase
MNDIRLSKYFTLSEMTKTSCGKENTPTPEAFDRLVRLCAVYLDPIREHFGPITITSGYRSKEVNDAIGGAKDSAHSYGCAADMVSSATVGDMIKWIVNESGLNYDQVIDECKAGSPWLHFGILRPNHEASPRKQALVFRDGVYTTWVNR